MSRCLHITINESSAGSPGRSTANRSGQMGIDPGSDYVMPRPDNPGSDYVMPRPDNPGSDYVMPRPDNPGSDYVMPRPDNPGSDYVMPRPDNPSGGSGPSTGAALGTPQVWTTVQSCCCGCGAPAGTCPGSARGTATPHPFIAPRDFSGFVIVRLAPGINPNASSLWELAGPPEKPRLPGLKAVLELPFKDDKEEAEKSRFPFLRDLLDLAFKGEEEEAARALKKPRHLISRPLVELSEGRADGSANEHCGGLLPRDKVLENIRRLEKRTALTAFPPLQSLTAYWRLDLREYSGLAKEVAARLNLLNEVDLAYQELSANDPKDGDSSHIFREDQGYLSDAPAGIGASWAWQYLEDPSKAGSLTICDLEQGWNPEHNDFRGENVLSSPIYGANRDQEGVPGHHGTAVLGQLAAAGRLKGSGPGLGRLILASHYLSVDERDIDGRPHPLAGTNGNVASALIQALQAEALKEGDILLLEVQRGLLPAEIDEADFNAIRLVSGLGILVIEAAGNGGFDLDTWSHPVTGRTLRRGDPRFRDSGAVLVGAARASVPHDRAPFSNYGSRLDCFGWGEAVTTCGYGDLSGTVDDDLYTNSFSGTSSASPIIAGAAALLQALHTKQAGCKLEPRAMRSLLSDPATGTHQGPGVPGHIGVMPDLKSIIQGLQLVPVIYMRRSVHDDGSAPGPDHEISSSPDILLWQGDLDQAVDRYGKGSRREHLPAPGDTSTARLDGTVKNHLYVRLRNRGLSKGKVRARLFASPAATLITPEHWIPWGQLDVTDPRQSQPAGIVPQGDTPFVAGPVSPAFRLNADHPNTPWSFLAVLSPLGEDNLSSPSNFVNWMAELPPGPPYFDWTQYRAFLRQPGVAWRNTHRVAGQSPVLPFFIAGTPDRERLFDFEMIQRLPEGAAVTLQVPIALDAKLRQRQPWHGESKGIFQLPTRPRTAIRGVSLAAGMHAEATLTVRAASRPINGSHSLAVRQLWRGEEVGRITWYFGLDTDR